MMTEPRIVDRGEQPYVGIAKVVTMQTFDAIADRIPEVFGWLAAHGLEAAGAPFFRFNLVDMERELEVEAGVPVVAVVPADGEMFCGVLPAGRYVTATHVGHPDDLVQATADVFDWAAELGLTWDVTDTPAGSRWRCRLSVLKTDPAVEPDMSKWETDLVFRLAD